MTDSDSRVDAVLDMMEDEERDGVLLDPGAPKPGTLHGLADVEMPDVIWWAPDVSAWYVIREAGYQQSVVLVPARGHDTFAPLHDDATAKRVAAWKKIVLCGGTDEFGDELARRLGRHRVYRASWPDGCVGACDTADRDGTAGLRACIDAAEPYPIDGIHYATVEGMLAYHQAKPPPTMTTGAGSTDKILHLPTEGKLIIVTGYPTHGKSTWLRHIMAHTAIAHGRRWGEHSPEMGEWQAMFAAMMAWRANKPFRSNRCMDGMTAAEVTEGAEWCRDRFVSIAADDEKDEPTVDWFFDRAAACVMRHGITDAAIDPWNKLAHRKGSMRDDDYVSDVLRRGSNWARRYSCNLWIAVHPSKPMPARPGEKLAMPTAYSINQGAMWYNMADIIVVVHRDGNATTINVAKSKFSRWGDNGASAQVELDRVTGRFRSAAVGDALQDAGYTAHAAAGTPVPPDEVPMPDVYDGP